MTKSRRDELSCLNIIFCLMVIFVHSASVTVNAMDKTSALYALMLTLWRMCPCAVQGFIFLAGVKLALSAGKPLDYPKYILKRILRVWVPYALASVVYFVYLAHIGYLTPSTELLIRGIAFSEITGHLYFVVAIMQFYLLAPLWRAVARRFDRAEVVVGALIVSYFISQLLGYNLADFLYLFNQSYVFPYCDRIFTTYLPFFVAGLAVGRSYEYIKSAASRALLPTSIVFAAALFFDALLGYFSSTGRAYVYWLEVAHTFYAIAAVCFLYTVSVRIGPWVMRIPVMKYIDRASYSIYLWHPLALYVCDRIITPLNLSMKPAFALRILFGYVLTIALCSLFSFGMGHLRTLITTYRGE